MKAVTISLDYETFSECDLKVAGGYEYAVHASTELLCMSYRVNDGPIVELTTPQQFKEFGTKLAKLLANPEYAVRMNAFNAQFERNISRWVCTRRYGWPEIPEDVWYCTMQRALLMSLPGSLEASAPSVGLEVSKDLEGRKIMLKLSKPDNKGQRILPDEITMPKLSAYCATDVAVEHGLAGRIVELSKNDRIIERVDRRINDRGVTVDRATCQVSLDIAVAELARLDQAMSDLTGGLVSRTSTVAALRHWLNESQGIDIDSLGKGVLQDILQADENDEPIYGMPEGITDLPPLARRAIELRLEAAKSSTKKLVKMLSMSDTDGRARGMFQFNGAHTGRWAGRGIQLQNLPRYRLGIKQQDVENIIQMLHEGDLALLEACYGPILHCIADTMRSMLIAAPGKKLTAVDWSNIEGRVIAWLAREEWKLQAFRDFDAGVGPDIYLISASHIYGGEPKNVTQVEPDARQHGKVAELAMGFQGGVGAFQTMAKVYNVVLPDERADEIKHAWRGAHPAVVKMWYALEDAFKNAIKNPGRKFEAARCIFWMDGSFVVCRLPSGRKIYYPYPRIEHDPKWGEKIVFKGPHPKTKRWCDLNTYGGKIAENITQAVANDFLRSGVYHCDQQDVDVVMHSHDEIIAEGPEDVDVRGQLHAIMNTAPKWAEGLPLATDKGWEGLRYRK